MSETENAGGGVRVNDRRRFDMNGNPRQSEENGREAPEQQTAAVEGEVIEPVAQAPAEGPSAEVERLQMELDAARRRVDELARAIQAGERDREAFKERLTRERERMIDVEKGNVALTLLEAVDELDLCLRASEESPLAQGVRMIRDGILQKLTGIGVERVELTGHPYDPNLAEAVDMEITGNEADDQKVVQELRPAYRMKDRVIRPGRVKVAKYVRPAEA